MLLLYVEGLQNVTAEKECDLEQCFRGSRMAAGPGFPNLQGSKSIQNGLVFFFFSKAVQEICQLAVFFF